MVFRLGKRVYRPSMVVILLLVAVPRSSVSPETPREDTLQEARRLAWLNNWTEAAQVLDRLERSGLKPADEASALFFKAAHIRGYIESMSLPDAAGDLASMIGSMPAEQDADLRLPLVVILGYLDTLHDLPPSPKPWAET